MKILGKRFDNTEQFYEHVTKIDALDTTKVSKKDIDNAMIAWMVLCGVDRAVERNDTTTEVVSILWGQWRGRTPWSLVNRPEDNDDEFEYGPSEGEFCLSDVGKAYLEMLSKELTKLTESNEVNKSAELTN